MASSSVDLPLPFSPTKKVTEGCRRSSSSARIAGSANGYSSKEGTSSRRSFTSITNCRSSAIDRRNPTS